MSGVIGVTTKSAEDTRELAAQLAALARGGDLLLLTGDLGAGKTTFAQGFARGLGVHDPVTSPTFTLVRIYRGHGRLRLVHADLYRLDRLHEVVDLALPELVGDDGVALVEWGEAGAPAMPTDYLVVSLEFGVGDDDRRLGLRVVGPGWIGRIPALRSALEDWDRAG